MQLKLVPMALADNEGWFEETTSDLKLVPIALAEDGWSERADRPAARRLSGGGSMYPGDRVLYRNKGELVPAVLIETAGGGCWHARDSRHGGNVFSLPATQIALRLTQPDLLGEAA